MSRSTYDLAILGGGPAGYAAALRAAAGAKVCLIEEDLIGGTCLNRGCIPTKCFCHSAKVFWRLKKGVLPEIKFDNLKLDYGAMLARKNEVVLALREGLTTLLEKMGVCIIRGRGIITSAGSLEIVEGEGKGKSVSAGMILVATGSRPGSLPFIPEDHRIHTTDSIWDLDSLPEHLLIIGGGVTGVEAATIYSTICKRVTVVEILPDILSNVNRSYRRLVAKSLKNRGVEILVGKRIVKINARKKLEVAVDSEENLHSFDAVLVASGRKPNVENVVDAELSLALKEGFIEVGEDMQTSVRGIYAAGDVVGPPMLAHAASREAIVAVNRGLGFDRNDSLNKDLIPDVIFSDPEIARVGFVPDATAKRDPSIKIGRFPYVTSSKALCEGEKEGFVEVVFDETKNKIVGGGVVGAFASELIGELIVAVYGELTPKAIEKAVHPHPTLTEMVWEANADSIGKAIYKIRNK